jgi:hypothetical protein
VVELESIACLPTKEKLPGTWWTVVKGNGQERSFESSCGVSLPDNDYSMHYLLVSAGRQMKRLTYVRACRWKHNNKDSYLGYETLGKELTPHTYYVYRMRPISIFNVEESGR